jgi:hypothetical protein
MSKDFTNRLRGIARTLSYNDEAGSEIKRALREAAVSIDAREVRIERVAGRLSAINGLGRGRVLNFKERLAWRFFRLTPAGTYLRGQRTKWGHK